MGKHFPSIAMATAVIALILGAIRPLRSAPSTAALRMRARNGQLPLTFEPNQGQADPRVKFISHGNGVTIFLTPTKQLLR